MIGLGLRLQQQQNTLEKIDYLFGIGVASSSTAGWGLDFFFDFLPFLAGLTTIGLFITGAVSGTLICCFFLKQLNLDFSDGDLRTEFYFGKIC